MFNKDGNYRAELSTVINTLFDGLMVDGNMIPEAERIKKVQAITDEYVAVTGERPIPEHLDRLSTYILKKDQEGAKWTQHKDAEYPYLSDRQYATRIAKETSAQGAENYDSAGVNQQTPTRSKRIQDELIRRKVK